jgi:peptidoglycan/LPS O-acetylase OafA/YrhL
MIPMPPSWEIRGIREMYAFNGPEWTLFYEYMASIAYALFLRKCSNVIVAFFAAIFAVATLYLTLTKGDVMGGWELNPRGIGIAFTRMAFPFCAGLLICRKAKLRYVPNGFLWCSLIMLVILVTPSIGGLNHTYANGSFEALMILLGFPILVWLGAGSKVESIWGLRICRFLGDISYPVYLVNYPIVYLFWGYIGRTHYTFTQTWGWALAVFVGTIVVSYAVLKWYDIPVRNWLTRRFLVRK